MLGHGQICTILEIQIFAYRGFHETKYLVLEKYIFDKNGRRRIALAIHGESYSINSLEIELRLTPSTISSSLRSSSGIRAARQAQQRSPTLANVLEYSPICQRIVLENVR